MRTAVESRQRWDALFNQFNSLGELKQALKTRSHKNPCEDGLRSVCWKAFLLHKNLDRASWPAHLLDTRSAYTALREHFLKYIEHPDDIPSTADPLAEDESSPWQSLRRNETIRAEIYQDVERCLQENYFFQEPTTKQRMLDILFIFVKLNPDLGYRQGMHELLAPVLWVVWQDAIEKESLAGDSVPTNQYDQVLLQALDADYIEHDAFAIFCAIMQTAKLFYEHDEMRSGVDRQEVSSIIARSQHIHQDILGSVDPELSSHLQAIEILPQIYLTRWLRLFFGREFPFENVLSVWDLLFAEDIRPGLIELVCVAMLLRIRWQLLSCDYSSALPLLLKYPSPEPHAPESFVLDALFLEDNLTLDGGALLISKYSGKSPELKPTFMQPHRARTTSQKRNSHSRNLSSRTSERNSPGISPLRINQKRLDSLFHDVSDGIYRRTEGWGVAKAVRGAVSEARRNIQGIQSSPSTPRLSSDDSPISNLLPTTKTDLAANRELRSRITALENRNKELADMLCDALQALCFNATKSESDSKEGAPGTSMGNGLETIERVRTLLRDSSIPITETIRENSPKRSSPVVTTDHAPIEIKDRPLVDRSNNRPASSTVTSPVSTTSSSAPLTTTTPTPPVKDPRPNDNDLAKPTPIRPVPRASLAESSFSWMLGGDQTRRSAFAPCASVPPEHMRRHESRVRPAALFGDDDRGDDSNNKRGGGGKRAGEAGNDVLVLDQLQGISKE